VEAVVLAVPARPAARLLAEVAPEAATEIGGLDYASVALITLALPEPVPSDLSGFLVPATEGLLVKASTFFTTKWGHLRRPDGLALVRASVGRYGEQEQLQRPDEDLAATVHRELSAVLGVPLPAPVAGHVQRWGGALPQYTPGHLDRVAAARAALRVAHPTLRLAGAGYDGVGIPICVRSGETAAEEIITALEGSGT
jgi:protoporphyrinogen/coproporphyrinogen III oxidase